MLNAQLTLTTAVRVLAQLRRDRRTLALVIVMPCVLLWLFSEVFAGSPRIFQGVAPVMLGLFPFITMFLVTSVAVVRERTTGTLERLLTTPLGKADLVVGYGLAFGTLALVQACVATAVSLGLLGLERPASVPVLLLLAVATAVLRYAADGMSELTGAATVPAAVWTNLGVVAGIAVLALALGAATLRRRTA